MTESTRITLLLICTSSLIYFPLFYFARRRRIVLWPYGLFILISFLVIVIFYLSTQLAGTILSIAYRNSNTLQYIAWVIPIIAIIVLLIRINLKSFIKKFTFMSADFAIKTPYWLERTIILLYKTLAWLFLGLFLGCLLAQMQGYLPIWFLFVYIPGSIGLAWLFIWLFLQYDKYKIFQLSSNDISHDKDEGDPARIDQLELGGIKMMETHRLIIFHLTVFPVSGNPYQTSIQQFMMEQDINRLHQGDIITFCQDKHAPGYGKVLTRVPNSGIPPSCKYLQIEKTYPLRRGTGLMLLFGNPTSSFLRPVNKLLIFIIVGFGFLSPYLVTGNLEWLFLKIKHFPQKLIFQHRGNFNPEEFKKTYDRAMAYIGDQRVDNLLFYKDFTNVSLELADNPGSVQAATIRGNSVEENFLSMPITEQVRLFTADSMGLDQLKKVFEDVSKDHDIKDISYIGFRKDTRRGSHARDIPTDYRKQFVDIHVVFEGGHEYLHYNGTTGERLPK